MAIGEMAMAYVIAEPCMGPKDAACVDACPVDCVHPKKNPNYDDGPAENHSIRSGMFAIQA